MDESTKGEMKGLREEFNQKKKELSKLKSVLNGANSEKEDCFRQLRSIRDKVRSKTDKIKNFKKERDDLTKKVKVLKGERDKLNKVVKVQSSKKKEVDQKKRELMGQVEFKGDPSQIKTEIDKLEMDIQIEVMPFKKEQELNKRIKELKLQFKELSKLGDVWKEINTTSTGFSEARKKAEDAHQQVQGFAQESQEKHELINTLYEEVKKLREEENPLAEKHLQLKVKYEQAKQEFEKVIKRINELKKLLNEEDENSYKAKAKEKTAEVKDKIKKGKKLSTEDILAFQATKD
jgi:uncharacterized coiled-coil DUF342 family protein